MRIVMSTGTHSGEKETCRTWGDHSASQLRKKKKGYYVLLAYLQSVGDAVGDVRPQLQAAVVLLRGDATDRPRDSQQVELDKHHMIRKMSVFLGVVVGAINKSKRG